MKKTLREAIVETILYGWSEMVEKYTEQAGQEPDENKAEACEDVASAYAAMRCQLCHNGYVEDNLWHLFTISKNDYYKQYPEVEVTTPGKNPCSTESLGALELLLRRVLSPILSAKGRARLGCSREDAEELYKATIEFLALQADYIPTEGFQTTECDGIDI